jgi:hypothetical protein
MKQLVHFFHVENLVKFNLEIFFKKINSQISLEEKNSKMFPISLSITSKDKTLIWKGTWHLAKQSY